MRLGAFAEHQAVNTSGRYVLPRLTRSHTLSTPPALSMIFSFIEQFRWDEMNLAKIRTWGDTLPFALANLIDMLHALACVALRISRSQHCLISALIRAKTYYCGSRCSPVGGNAPEKEDAYSETCK